MDEQNQNNKNNGLFDKAEKAKKLARKAKLLPIKIKIISCIVVFVVLLSSFIWLFSDLSAEKISKTAKTITDYYTQDEDGAIIIKNEAIDAIIESIKELGINLEDIYLKGDIDYTNSDLEAREKEALRKYIRKFYEAQAMTETINTNPDWLDEEKNDGKIYGTIYLYRTDSLQVNEEQQGTPMTYVAYDELKELVEKAQNKLDTSVSLQDVAYKFSLNEEKKLVIPTWETEIVKRDGQLISDTLEITLLELDYKTAVSQYSTPMIFLVYLAMTTQNPEFASAVADLVKRTRVELTIMDGQTINEDENHYVCTQHTKTRRKVTDAEGNTKYETSSSTEQIDTTTVRKTTTIRPTMGITYARTWFCEQRITYNKNIEELEPMITVDGPHNEPEPSFGPDETGTKRWKTGETTTITVNVTKERYEEGVRGDVIDKTGEKGSQGLNEEGKVDDNTTFLGLMSNRFKRANSTSLDSTPAGYMLVEGAQWLWGYFQKDESLQNMEMLMRYILYKYSGNNYGVTSFDFSIFDAKDFKSINSSGIVGSSVEDKVWYTLRNLGYSEYAVAGVMGNIYAESGFNPSIIEKGSGAGFGLCQWTGGRRDKLEAYAASKGVDPGDVNTQIEFLIAELTPGGGANGYANYALMTAKDKTTGVVYRPEDWKNANDVESATRAFCFTFERPGIPRIEIRISKAKEYYEQYKGKTMQPGAETIVNNAIKVHKYLRENGYTYAQRGINVPNLNGTTIDCSSFVTWVLIEAGTPGFSSGMYQWSSATFYSNPKGWQEVSRDEAQPGDIVVYKGHVEIIAANTSGDRFRVYNCGGNESIRAKGTQNLPETSMSGYTKSQALVILRAPTN